MTMQSKTIAAAAPVAATVFPPASVGDFEAHYPEEPHKLRHDLRGHPLLTLEALAELGEQLPGRCIEYNRGDLPIGIEGKPEGNGLTIGETIRNIDDANSWAVLKNIEQVPAYADLLHGLLAELAPHIEGKTGALLRRQAFVFVSSPGAVTPYHFDPEHNILLQLVGQKAMTIFPAGDPAFAPDELHEAYHTGGGRELRWDEALSERGRTFDLAPGEAVFVPVMAPHFVRNGDARSISLSITWRSEWSFAEADARAFNKMLRDWGFDPKPPKRWPASNRAKAIGCRIARRIPGLG